MACCTCLDRHPKTKLALRLFLASVSLVIGLAAAAVFGIHFNNRQAAIWALISSMYSASAIAIFIYLYVVREVKHQPPSRWVLLAFGMLSGVALAASFGAFVAYLGLGIIDSINHAGKSIYQTYYISCVWTLATFRAALTPYFYSIASLKYCPDAHASHTGYKRINNGGLV